VNRLSTFSDGEELESASEGHELKGQGYSERDEKRILDALGRGLLNEFPNPERAGCPGRDVLKRIASHDMPLTEAEKWLDHLTSCSPCYRDFSQLKNAQELRRRRMWLAIAAGILLCASLGGWALVRWHNGTQTVQTATLDLRDWSVARGAEPNPNLPSVEINRKASSLTILLPVGSAAGAYEICIVTRSGNSVLTASGTAELENGITRLQVAAHLRSVSPGSYVLQIRTDGLGWNSYPLILH
jgi:hypothetical protein